MDTNKAVWFTPYLLVCAQSLKRSIWLSFTLQGKRWYRNITITLVSYSDWLLGKCYSNTVQRWSRRTLNYGGNLPTLQNPPKTTRLQLCKHNEKRNNHISSHLHGDFGTLFYRNGTRGPVWVVRVFIGKAPPTSESLRVRYGWCRVCIVIVLQRCKDERQFIHEWRWEEVNVQMNSKSVIIIWEVVL